MCSIFNMFDVANLTVIVLNTTSVVQWRQRMFGMQSDFHVRPVIASDYIKLITRVMFYSCSYHAE